MEKERTPTPFPSPSLAGTNYVDHDHQNPKPREEHETYSSENMPPRDPPVCGNAKLSPKTSEDENEIQEESRVTKKGDKHSLEYDHIYFIMSRAYKDLELRLK